MSNTRPEKVKNRLREVRSQSGLSQAEVAKHMGLSIPMISKQEDGSRRISKEQARKYARLYRCSLMDLFIKV